MSIQLSVAVRNAKLNSIEPTIGASPKLQIRTGSPPANCAESDSGVLLCEIEFDPDWLNSASGGGTTKTSGVWTENSIASGDAGHFRLKNAAGITTHMQGTVTGFGGGGDMELTSVSNSVAINQPLTVGSFTLTEGNA